MESLPKTGISFSYITCRLCCVVLICAVLGIATPFVPISSAQAPALLLGGTFSSNIARTSIDAYSNDQLCGAFTNGSGSHFSIRSAYESAFSSSVGWLASFAVRNLSSSFSTAPFNLEHAFDVTSGNLTTISRERLYDVSIYGIGIGGGITYHLFERVTVSGELSGYFIPDGTYEQSEHLITPSVVYSDTKLSTRTVSSGSFATNHFFAALEFSGGYDVPLSERMSLRPYVEGFIGLTPIANINGVAYRSYSINGGVSLAYHFPATEQELPKEIIIPPIPTPAVPPTPAPKPASLRLAVRAVGLTDHDEEVSQPVVSIENVLVTDVSPTLGYVFFDDGSSTIASRYHQYASGNDAKNFSMKDFYTLDAFGINHELLNVLGKRLTDHPKTTITLTGTRSIHSSGDSAAADMIALNRAEHVGEYLQNVWQIAPSRIKVRSRTLPEMNSDDGTLTGEAENRRVEITASNRDILEPVETKRLEQTATPPRIKFYQDIYSASGLRSNKITISQGGRVIQTFDKLSGESRSEWLWNISQADALKGDDSVLWTMEVTDSSGQSSSVSGIIRIRPQEHTRVVHARDTADADKTLERFHLLLFDYSSSSELGQNSDDVLNKLAASITSDARVTITGHTDITGDPSYNEKLSYDRASRASLLLSNKLRMFGKSVPALELEARGSKDILFDNSVAEGRMLSRTVRVTVERDLK